MQYSSRITDAAGSTKSTARHSESRRLGGSVGDFGADTAPFWANDERYSDLREGFVALCALLNHQPPWFSKQASAKYPGVRGLTPITFRRFCKDASRKHLRSPGQLSALLLTCDRVLRESGLDEAILEGPVRKLVALADLFGEVHGSVEPRHGPVSPPPASASHVRYPREKLKNIVDHIHAPQFVDISYPEFPPNCPRWPATPTIRLNYEGVPFLLKDESVNPTGTHKDRWAWEILIRCRDRIKAELAKGTREIDVVRYSMISSGSAALSLQMLLRAYQLPDLHVAMDLSHPNPRVKQKLEAHGAHVKLVDLSNDILSESDVCRLTDNLGGEDITPRHAKEAFDCRYYDWLVYEILVDKPKHVFVPFGTGGLYANIIYTLNSEWIGEGDSRLLEGIQSLTNVNVYGATSDDPKSNMNMLYAPHRPALEGIEAARKSFIADETIGPLSEICTVSDRQAKRAMDWLRGEGLRTDWSGAAGLALFMERAESLPKGETALVVNTGTIALPN